MLCILNCLEVVSVSIYKFDFGDVGKWNIWVKSFFFIDKVWFKRNCYFIVKKNCIFVCCCICICEVEFNYIDGYVI